MVAINLDKIKAFLASDKKTYKGLEKENLRTDIEGKISGNKFPSNLGSHHFNKYITLDYSEPHFEIVWNLQNSADLAFKTLFFIF